ncbi:MAG: FeoC-like transcriptional regulator [Gloeomargarita sp. HHBFW_bins_162]
MLLQEIQTYVRKHRRVSLETLGRYLQIDADALRPMLALLIRKGKVRRLEQQPCGGCHHCAPESLELYEWIAD